MKNPRFPFLTSSCHFDLVPEELLWFFTLYSPTLLSYKNLFSFFLYTSTLIFFFKFVSLLLQASFLEKNLILAIVQLKQIRTFSLFHNIMVFLLYRPYKLPVFRPSMETAHAFQWPYSSLGAPCSLSFLRNMACAMSVQPLGAPEGSYPE